MTRAVAHYPPREIAILGLVEGALSFLAFCSIALTIDSSIAASDASVSLGNDVWVALCLTGLLGILALTAGFYRPGIYLAPVRAASGAAVASLVFSALILVRFSAGTHMPRDRVVSLATLVIGWSFAILTVRIVHAITLRHWPLTRRVLLVGDADEVTQFQYRLSTHVKRRFQPVHLQAQDWTWKRLRESRIWGVILTADADESTLAPLLDCKLRGMRILSAPAFQELYLGRIELDSLTESDLLTGRSINAGWMSDAVKRLLDVVFGLSLLVLTLPLMLLTAIAIRLDSPGPVLYAQRRTGQYGKPFTLLKFRSMAVNAEAGGKPCWAQRHDPRITRVGRFIRSTRIDELPQLLHVLRGEMSLVGPRPERPHFVEQLTQAIPFYEQRGYVKPGLTGWAQVNFPYGASIEDSREKLAYDLYYVKNRSVALDIAILFATIRVVL
ncbi:MAG TPA: sugar transferase, partial [Rhodopila sp.]|nr:sugar transferase [Rhodopila sp.]